MCARQPRIPKAPGRRGGGEMSLINEMLRDLEARRAGELTRPDLQREIRPLPEAVPSRRRSLPWLLALLVVSGAGAAWWWVGTPAPWETTPPVPAPAPMPAAPAVTPPPPVVKAPEPSEAAISDALRMADSLANPPAEAAAPVVPLPPEPLAKVEPPRTVAGTINAKSESPSAKAEASVAKPKVQEAAGSVEKTATPLTPREKAEGEYRKAMAQLGAGQTAAGIEALRGALRLDPGYGAARQQLLRTLLEAHRLDEGIQVLQEGLEVQPQQIGWAMSLARLQVERSDVAAAEKTLAKYRGSAAGSAEYAGFHGHLLLRLGRGREAVEAYQQAVRLGAADGRWWFGLGQSLEAEGRAAEGREAFRRALATNNLNADLAALAEQKIR